MYKLGKQWGIYKFLYMPNSAKALWVEICWNSYKQPSCLKNWEITLEVNDHQYVEVLSLILTTSEAKEEMREKIINQVFPGVWATDVPGRAKNAPPIQIKLKEGKQPVRVKKYPIKKEDREEISPTIEIFL